MVSLAVPDQRAIGADCTASPFSATYLSVRLLPIQQKVSYNPITP